VEVDEKFYRPAEVQVLQGDFTKAREKLGWQPRISFSELVKEMVDADLRYYWHEGHSSLSSLTTANLDAKN
jgi:GDPmannose 4,6-dehydratase